MTKGPYRSAPTRAERLIGEILDEGQLQHPKGCDIGIVVARSPELGVLEADKPPCTGTGHTVRPAAAPPAPGALKH